MYAIFGHHADRCQIATRRAMGPKMSNNSTTIKATYHVTQIHINGRPSVYLIGTHITDPNTHRMSSTNKILSDTGSGFQQVCLCFVIENVYYNEYTNDGRNKKW